MELNEAKQIYTSFVNFSNQELAASGGNLKNANAVARLNGHTVVAATDDSIHKAFRNADLKAANTSAHTAFKEAILTLFGAKQVSELPPSVQAALQSLSKDARPLSARRIHVITQDVNIALMSAKGSTPITDQLQAMGRAVNDEMTGSRSLETVKTLAGNAFAAITQDAKLANEPLINDFLASVKNTIDGAKTYNELVAGLTARATEFSAALGQANFAPGTRSCAAGYGVKQVAGNLVDELAKRAYLAKIDTIRANIANLKVAHANEPAIMKFLAKLETEASDAELKKWNFAQFEVERLEFVASEEYVGIVNKQVGQIVKDTIQAEKELIQQSYDRQTQKTHDELMPAGFESKIESDMRATALANAWERLAGDTSTGVRPDELGSKFHEAQDTFVKDVHGKIESDVQTAVNTEKKRVEADAQSLKITLLSPEDEKAFITDMCDEFAKTAWNQIKTTGKVELPTERIEDAYAKTYSKGLHGQGENIVKEIVGDMHKTLDAAVAKCAQEINEKFSNVLASEHDTERILTKSEKNLKAKEEDYKALEQEIKNAEKQMAVDKNQIAMAEQGKIKIASKHFFGNGLKELKEKVGNDAAQLAEKRNQLRLLGSEVENLKFQIFGNREALGLSRQDRATASQRSNDFVEFAKAGVKNLEECKNVILESLSSGKSVDIASLKTAVERFKAEVGKVMQFLDGYSAEKEVAKPEFLKPESLTVNSRFGLHDPENFARRVEVGAKGFLKGIVTASDLDDDKKATLERVVDNTFGAKNAIPAKIVGLGLARCANQTNESVARVDIEDNLALYLKCVIDGVKAGTLALDANGTLPELDEQVVVDYATVETQREHEENLNSAIPALGNDRKFTGAISVLRNFGEKGGQIAGEIERLLPLFNGSANASKYASAAFNDAYKSLLAEKLDHVREDGTTVRDYVAKLLVGIMRNNDASNLEASGIVLANARDVQKILGAIVDGAEREAHQQTLDSLPKNVRALVGLDNLTSLDKTELVSRFLKRTGLNDAEFAEMDAVAVERVRSFLPFVDGTFANKRAYAAVFIRSVAAGDFPVSLLNENSRQMLEGLITLRLKLDTGRVGQAAEQEFVRGFDTYDAKEILKMLALDGLQNLKCEAHTPRVLSLLYALNGSKAGGLKALCNEAFSCDISSVDANDLKKARDMAFKNIKDGVPLLYSLGQYSVYKRNSDELSVFTESANRTRVLTDLLAGGIEPLFANADKKHPAPTIDDIRDWVKALDLLASTGKPTPITLRGIPATLTLADDGSVEATVVGERGEQITKHLSITPAAIKATMMEAMFRHVDLYVKGSVGELVTFLPDESQCEARRYALMVVTSLAEKKSFGSFDPVKLAGMSTHALVALAKDMIVDYSEMKQSAFLNRLKLETNIVYSPEITDSLNRLAAAEAAQGKDAINAMVKVPDVTTPMLAPSQESRETINAEMAKLQNEFTMHFVNTLVDSKLSDPDLMSLKSLAGTESIDMSNGYGAFLKKVLTNYFTGMGDLDKSLLYAAVKAEAGEGATPYQRIAALVKNSGPVLVKMLQGIPLGAVGSEFRNLMGEVKGSLPSIPTEVTRAQLLDIIARSNGQITGIEVKKSLGAASVGEALLCRVSTPSNPDGEDVVIKLLRPNVQMTAQREIDFIHNVLHDTSFDARLAGILKELDLTQEADNVEIGRGYSTIARSDDKGRNIVAMERVRSMELHSLARPSVMSVVIRKASGETCEKFFSQVETRLGEILSSMKHVEEPPADKLCYRNAKGGKVVTYRTDSVTDFAATKDELIRLYDSTRARQNDLLNLVYKWASFGLFPKEGEKGFIHGDLQDCNIMTDERMMTFIDFGNAMTLSKDDRENILCSLVYCLLGKDHSDDFTTILEGLGVKFRDAAQKKAVIADLTAVFAKGTGNDTGLRYAAAMSVLQMHQIEIPALLNNFSQSLLRLQNAVERANDSLRKIEGMLRGLRFDPTLAANTDNPLRVTAFDEDPVTSLDVEGSDTEVVSLMNAFLGPAMREGHLETVVADLCKDSEGHFSVEAVRTKLLPVLAQFKNSYPIPSDINAKIPEDEEKPGYQLYKMAEGLLRAEFDLDNEVDAGKFRQIVTEISDGVSVAYASIQTNLTTNLTMFDEIVAKKPPQAFSAMFQKCILDHSAACQDAAWSKIAKNGLKTHKAVGLVGELEAARKISDAEQKAISEISAVDKKFMVSHPDFPVDVLRRVSEVANGEFVHEAGTFGAKWGKNDALLRRGANILARNIAQLKAALVRDGYEEERDTGKYGLKTAIDLSVAHMISRFNLDTSIKALDKAQFDRFLSYLPDDDSRYAAQLLYK
ncbi:MAG: phosphotransferase [Kiritimatiellae bacterium]|nr:phosphotransferase [Kiritimatiellia bacterium]